jgi:hypothetical protein
MARLAPGNGRYHAQDLSRSGEEREPDASAAAARRRASIADRRHRCHLRRVIEVWPGHFIGTGLSLQNP